MCFYSSIGDARECITNKDSIPHRVKKDKKRSFPGKKKFPSDPSCCPACGVTVRPQELEQHFAQELDRLYKISSASSRARASRSSLPPGHPQDHPHGPMLHAPSTADGTPHGRWETYKRIKANRQVNSNSSDPQ